MADKARVVTVLLNRGVTEAQIAGKYKLPKYEIEVWEKAFLKGDWSVLFDDD